MRRAEGKVRKEVTPAQIGAIAGVFSALVLGLAFGVRACTKSRPPEIDGGAIADWCAEGLEPMGDACFANGTKGLIVYVHGRYPPEQAKDERELQARVARMATGRGFAVIAFRGKQGACPAPEVQSYFCWPSNERTQDAGPEVVSSWSPSLAEAEKRTGNIPRYLLGFSNGAYFATLIATRALLPFDAVAIVSGGPVEPTKARGSKPPILLVTGDDDAAQPEMLRLESELKREGWPLTFTSREGSHTLAEFDIGTALDFFEKKKIASRRPIPFDAGAGADAAPQETPPIDSVPARTPDPIDQDPADPP